jgi:hypothetical protein
MMPLEAGATATHVLFPDAFFGQTIDAYKRGIRRPATLTANAWDYCLHAEFSEQKQWRHRHVFSISSLLCWCCSSMQLVITTMHMSVANTA